MKVDEQQAAEGIARDGSTAPMQKPDQAQAGDSNGQDGNQIAKVFVVIYLAGYLVRRQKEVRADVLAGLTTSFALLPECIAFALVAHLNPLMGLYGAR